MHNAFCAEFFLLMRTSQHLSSTVCGLLSLLLLLHLFAPSLAQDQSLKARTKRAYMEGDIMIGVLMPMHKQSDKKNDYREACGVIWEGYGIHRLEQLFRTIDEINSRSDLLPGVTLGYDVRDSCWTIPVALEQSIDFIRNKIGTLDKQMGGTAEGTSSTGQTHQTSARGDCSPQQRGKTIAALIGPGSSTISGPIQNVLQLFEIPEIDFGATAVELSDKNKHRYFSRVVPSDRQQARVLVDIILRHNWTYIHAVHTDGMYGENGMEEFKAMLSKTGACIAVDKKLKSNVPAGDAQYMELLNEIRSKGKDKAKVIVCFCDGMAVHGIFNATATYRRMHPDYDGKFMVIGSDGWNVREDVVKGVETTANGGVSIKLHSPKIDDFEVYYSKINPLTNTRNPWFQEFWEYQFNCTFDRSMLGWKKHCDPTIQKIDPAKVEQDAKLGFVVNAVYALAHAFHNMLAAHCPKKDDFSGCLFINQTINGSMVFSYLRNVTFLSYSNDSIKFDEFMDGVGRYEIMTYRFNDSITSRDGRQGAFEYQKIGWWDSGNLWLKDLVDWPNVTEEHERHIESVCSKSCEKGKVKKIQEGGVPCCWSCQQCLDHEYIISDSRCMPCQAGWWPDENLTSCLPLEIKYKSLTDKDSIVCIVFALFGVLSCGFVLIIFGRHNSTPVVKASTRELTYIILAGVFLSYLTTVPLLMKPTLVSCYFTRILPGFSFSLIYGALATKTNRIARILSGSKKKIITRKPRFLSASAQVVITCLIVGTECVIITLMLILEPADSVLDYPSKKEVRLKCNTTDYGLMVPFGFDMFLIAMCTLYAVRTRNMPENFNEAKFIGFCMYTTCAVWASFVPIYYNSDSRMTTMSFCISASATAGLIFLFYPKIYIMVYQPEKNTKSAFTSGGDSTRSHMGSMAIGGGGGGGERDRIAEATAREYNEQRLPSPDSAVKRVTHRKASQPKAQLEEMIADKLVEVILPPPPPKMPKPKTISELMHQRRMSVASAGSAERLLAAALRHSRGSMVPMMTGVPANFTRGDSVTGSQEFHTRLSESLGPHETQSGEESPESCEPITVTNSLNMTPEKRTPSYNATAATVVVAASPAESPVKSGDKTTSSGEHSSSEPEDEETPFLPVKAPVERQDSDVGALTDSSSVSIEISQVNSNAETNGLDSRLPPVALLLPRPSPIPEEDEETADNSSSHLESSSPHMQKKLSPAKSSSSRQSHSGKSPSSDHGPVPTKKSSSSDNGSTTYVNLDAIQHHQQRQQREEELPAPPLPPKPARLFTNLAPTRSGLAGRLIDHLYSSSRASDKGEKERKAAGSVPKKLMDRRVGPHQPHQQPQQQYQTQQHQQHHPHPHHQPTHHQPQPRTMVTTYTIPEGPPRPISPTEHHQLTAAKRHQEIGGKYGSNRIANRPRVFQKLIPFTGGNKQAERSSRYAIVSSIDALSKGPTKFFHRHPRSPSPTDTTTGSVSSTNDETNASSSTFAELPVSSTLRPKALLLNGSPHSKRTKSQSEHQSVLLSPMSSTSYDTRSKPPGFSDTLSDTVSSTSTLQPVHIGPKAQVQMGTGDSQLSTSETSSPSYEESSVSSPQTAVTVRLARNDRQGLGYNRQMYIHPQPRDSGSQSLAPSVWRVPHRPSSGLPSMRTSELANEGGVLRPPAAVSFTTSSISSGLSQDTLADLPSIEELSVTGMRLLDDEEVSAVRFKEYMNNLGVDIDLSVFQSTEV